MAPVLGTAFLDVTHHKSHRLEQRQGLLDTGVNASPRTHHIFSVYRASPEISLFAERGWDMTLKSCGSSFLRSCKPSPRRL